MESSCDAALASLIGGSITFDLIINLSWVRCEERDGFEAVVSQFCCRAMMQIMTDYAEGL